MSHNSNFDFLKNKKLFNKPVKFKKKRREFVYETNFKIKKHFSGSSPPEIFVGRYNYPNINAGILSPDFYKNTKDLSMPEEWHKKNLGIGEIITNRSKLIYARFKTQIKNNSNNNKFKTLMQEIAMTHKSIDTEVFLKSPPKKYLEINKFSPVITNLATLENARLQENTKVLKKVDYLVGDTHSKATQAISELHSAEVPTSTIQKILSAGLLGLKTKRKLVPTRWSITAVDDTIGKELLKGIRHYKEIEEILVFNANYLGNYYEILILPGNFSFEIIEADIKFNEVNFWQDHENFHGRKNYAENVAGGYYVARLAVCEYLEEIRKQGTVVIFREITNEYYAPLGVGILRETCRSALSKNPEKFNTKEEAILKIQERLSLNIEIYKEKSVTLKDYGKQKKLWDFN